MDLLTEMILQIDKNGARQYKVYSGRSSDEEARKDQYLFDYIRRVGEGYDDDKVFKKLYPSEDKNSWYRLKGRLVSDLSRSVFLHQHANNDNMLCFYYAALAHYYHSVNVPRVALHFFKKGELKAKEIENYGMLDIIYSRIIKLAREIPAINPEEYIKKRQDNRALLNRLSEVEDILAVFEYKMNATQNLANNNTPIPELLENMLNEYTHDEDLKQSFKVQFGIYFIVSHVLLQGKNYVAMLEYLIPTYNAFTERNFFNKSNHQHKLKMLSWIANAAFMKKDYQLSLQYTELLYNEMKAFDKIHYDIFELFYYNLRMANYSEINPEKAIGMLLNMSKIKSIQQNAYYMAFTFLNLSVLYFKQKQYSQAIVNLNKAYGHEGYKSIDDQIKVKASIGELMIRYDMKEYDFLEYRIKQIMKETKDLLAEPGFAKEAEFLQLLQQMTDDPSVIRKAAFRESVKKYLFKYENEWSNEEGMFKYNEWLKNKI